MYIGRHGSMTEDKITKVACSLLERKGRATFMKGWNSKRTQMVLQ